LARDVAVLEAREAGRERETQRVLRLYEREAHKYDREMQVFERLLFGDGRQWVCSQAEGEVLEIAVGTGRNLPYYGEGVRLTGIELSPAMLEIARTRAHELGRDADFRVVLEAEGGAAAAKLTAAAEELVAAYRERERIAGEISRLAGMLGRTLPGDVSYSRAEQAVRQHRRRSRRAARSRLFCAGTRGSLGMPRRWPGRRRERVAGVSDVDELRAEVAAAHGLPPGSASFLTGATVAEVEASARAFATLVGQRSQEPDPPVGVFERAAAAKAERKRELADLFCGRPPQPRDEHGRFAVGFDGGARQPVPQRRSPEREHNELLVALSRFSRAYGAGF
jgi:Methyltransferase domain